MSSTYEIILKATDQYSSEVDKFQNKLKQTTSEVNNLGNQSEKTGGKISSAFNLSNASVLGLVLAAGKSISAFNEKNKIMTQTESIIRSTGYAAGMTAKDVKDLADKFSKLTNFDDDEILGGQNLLLTFKRIGSEVFPEATEAMLDLATRMGTDAKGAAQVLGKALQNPIEASGMLKKAGIDLTFAQEKQIEAFQKTGELGKAQKVILDELRGTIGGLAQDSASPLDQLLNQLGDLGEILGESLFPAFTELTKNVLIPFAETIQQNKEAVIGFTAILAALVLPLTGPVGIVAALALVGFGLNQFKGKWNLILLQVTDLITGFVQYASSALGSLFKSIGLDSAGDKLNSFATKMSQMRKELQEDIELERESLSIEEEKLRIEKEKAAAGGKKGKDAANKSAKGDANKSETSELEKELKKRFGMVNAELIAEYNFEKSFNQKKNREQLLETNKITRDKQRIKSTYTKFNEKQVDAMYEFEQQKSNQDRDNEVKKEAFRQNLGNIRMEYTQNLLGNLSSLQNSKTREFFELGKAASIASATINTYEAVTKTMASVPYPFNIPLAIAQGLAGMTQVQGIASQTFQDGGIVQGDNYSGDKVNIRVNSGEMVLNSRQQRELFERSNGNSQKVENSEKNTYLNYNVSIVGNGDKDLKNKFKKMLDMNKNRKLRKQQFVKGRI